MLRCILVFLSLYFITFLVSYFVKFVCMVAPGLLYIKEIAHVIFCSCVFFVVFYLFLFCFIWVEIMQPWKLQVKKKNKSKMSQHTTLVLSHPNIVSKSMEGQHLIQALNI